jgi:hypothetical protein
MKEIHLIQYTYVAIFMRYEHSVTAALQFQWITMF